MTAEPPPNRDLVARLLAADGAARAGVHRRLLARPWRMLFPRLLSSLGRTRWVEARTFWGAAMRVLLPETVSKSVWRYGFFEADVCRFLLAALRGGMTFVDVGAHLGFFTLLGSRLVGPRGAVVAIEPTPSTFEALASNCTASRDGSNIRLVDRAAHDSPGELEFRDFGLPFSAYNSAHGARREGGDPAAARILRVRADTVDRILAGLGLERVHMVKIDAESSEREVLRGMEATLASSRPAVVVEVGDYGLDDVAPSSEVVAWLADRGYVPWDVSPLGIGPHSPRERYAYGNLLFLPRELAGPGGLGEA